MIAQHSLSMRGDKVLYYTVFHTEGGVPWDPKTHSVFPPSRAFVLTLQYIRCIYFPIPMVSGPPLYFRNSDSVWNTVHEYVQTIKTTKDCIKEYIYRHDAV